MEEWRVINDFPSYEISSEGNVRRGKRLLKLQKAPTDAYYHVTLSKHNKQYQFYVHRLVAIHFIPNPDKLPQVNHINGNKSINKVSNLEWASVSHNTQHAYDNKLIAKPVGELNSQHKLTWDKVNSIRELKNSYTKKELSKLFEVSESTINDILSNRTWKRS